MTRRIDRLNLLAYTEDITEGNSMNRNWTTDTINTEGAEEHRSDFASGATLSMLNADGTIDFNHNAPTLEELEELGQMDTEDEWEPDNDGVERYLQGQEDREPPAGWEP